MSKWLNFPYTLTKAIKTIFTLIASLTSLVKKKSYIFQIHLFHYKYISNLITYLLIYHSRLTNIKKIIQLYMEHHLCNVWSFKSCRSFLKCKIFKVYLKYTCNISTLARSNISVIPETWDKTCPAIVTAIMFKKNYNNNFNCKCYWD